ncbi:MAG: antibiotic ABC transporter ATP-binding protein [Kiritimatiellaceae bacterium]|nr:antibiotic ABC transporter ATP-binding protein [Kiritimatiellaceae bacterium]
MKITRQLLTYIRPYRLWLAGAFLLILSTSLAINYLPLIIQRITDDCLMQPDQPVDQRIELLGKLSLLYVVIAGIGHLVRYLQGLLTAYIGQRIIYDLRLAVFRKVLTMHQAYFDRTPVGTLMTRVTSDIERLQNFVTDGVVGTLADLFMLLGIMGYMLYISPPLAGTLFLTLPVLYALLVYINRNLRNANREIRDKQAAQNAYLQESLTGMNTIQLFNREASAIQDFDEKHTQLRTAYFKEVRWFSLSFPTVEGGQALASLLILGMGGILLLNGSEFITLGIFIAFLAYVRDFFRPLSSLSEKASSFQVALASVERVFSLLNRQPDIQNNEHPIIPPQLSGTIEFKNVWFAYDDDNWVIKDLSFKVEPGQALAIVGATGAGKSTIINLIGRFYDIQQGTITIDGINIRDFDQTDLRQRLGYVFQDPFLFAGTISDNIGLHNPDLTTQQIEKAAQTVNAHTFIDQLKNNYNTPLNERGEGLSLGQKQLLVMARTFAQNPELLFVLDEATASIDTATELLIQDALGKLMQNRTSIIIAHRLSTIRHADRILVMRGGELIDSGTHDELIAHHGYYHQLCQLMQHQA